MTTPCHSEQLVIAPPNASIPLNGGLAILPSNPSIPVGGEVLFGVIGFQGVPVTWSSSDNNIATINAYGSAKGVGVGTTRIQAELTWIDGQYFSGFTNLTVTEPAELESSDAIGVPVSLR